MEAAAAEVPPDWWPHQGEFPDWHVWRGVAGLLYARRPRSSPAMVARGTSPPALRDDIVRLQIERARRRGW